MVLTLVLQKKREKREQDLDIIIEQRAINDQKTIRIKSNYEKKLKSYYQWLRENKINGLKYPLPRNSNQ